MLGSGGLKVREASLWQGGCWFNPSDRINLERETAALAPFTTTEVPFSKAQLPGVKLGRVILQKRACVLWRNGSLISKSCTNDWYKGAFGKLFGLKNIQSCPQVADKVAIIVPQHPDVHPEVPSQYAHSMSNFLPLLLLFGLCVLSGEMIAFYSYICGKKTNTLWFLREIL